MSARDDLRSSYRVLEESAADAAESLSFRLALLRKRKKRTWLSLIATLPIMFVAGWLLLTTPGMSRLVSLAWLILEILMCGSLLYSLKLLNQHIQWSMKRRAAWRLDELHWSAAIMAIDSGDLDLNWTMNPPRDDWEDE